MGRVACSWQKSKIDLASYLKNSLRARGEIVEVARVYVNYHLLSSPVIFEKNGREKERGRSNNRDIIVK
jgi:hypothetical protein